MSQYAFSKQQIVGIIPAAGKGSRLAPYPCPKELYPIGYQDILIDGKMQKRPKVISQYLVENMVAAGANKLFIILGENKHEIMQYYGDGRRFGIDISYLYQEKLNGMPFAVNLTHSWLNGETILFGMPDTIIEPKDAFSQLLEFHNTQASDLTLGLFSTDNPAKFGMVELNGENQVKMIIDKPASTSLKYMCGCASWSEPFSSMLNTYMSTLTSLDQEVVLGDVFSFALRENINVNGLVFDQGQYIDIGTVDELDAALKKFHL